MEGFTRSSSGIRAAGAAAGFCFWLKFWKPAVRLRVFEHKNQHPHLLFRKRPQEIKNDNSSPTANRSPPDEDGDDVF